MTVDSWNDLLNFIGVLLVGATFIVGFFALLTGRVINKRQAAELVRLSTDLTNAQVGLAEQQTRAADAESRLLELQERLTDRRFNEEQNTQLVNWLTVGPTVEAADAVPEGTARILVGPKPER